MSALRQRMIKAMQMHGFSPRTHMSYLAAVRGLAKGGKNEERTGSRKERGHARKERGQVFPFAFLKLDLGTWPGPFVSNMPVRCTM